MLKRLVIALYLAASIAPALAGERDHLRKGEEKLTEKWDVDYNRAVSTILGRGWQRDVVVRALDLTAGPPEWASGIARTSAGYRAFEVIASAQIWGELSDTSSGQRTIKRDYSRVRPVLHERSLSDALSARIAALWRRVLADRRNYEEETKIYVDTDVFTFDLMFASRERFTAHTTGWGPRTEQLIIVARTLASYAKGAPESELVKAVSRAERKAGI
jgi:hypothetical protein